MNLHKKSGYTLIELVVVIAIIGVLLSMSLAGMNGARTRSRDARRVADLRTIQSALELYAASEPSRSYPLTLNELLPKYIGSLPTDPTTKLTYGYFKPACIPATGNMLQGTVSGPCSPGTVKATYGLQANLETDNSEARSDASPTDGRTYHLIP